MRFASPSDANSSRSMSAEPIRAERVVVSRAVVSRVVASATLVLLIGAGLEKPKAPVAATSESRVGRCMVVGCADVAVDTFDSDDKIGRRRKITRNGVR